MTELTEVLRQAGVVRVYGVVEDSPDTVPGRDLKD